MIGEISTSTTAWTPKKLIVFFNAYLSVSAVMFCKQLLAYAVHIDRFGLLCNP